MDRYPSLKQEVCDDASCGKFSRSPGSQLGWWAVGLSVLFVVLFVSVSTGVLPFSGLLTMVLGVVAGILTLAAVLWKGEHSWLLLPKLLPGLLAIVFALGEILVPH